MSGIRPFARQDVEAVARLYEVVVRSGRDEASPGVAAWLRRVVLDQPWADDDVPSLVATTPDGSVVGFLASHVRRLCAQGRPVRLGCCGHLVVHPSARNRAVGVQLLATYLRGPQDLSITDGATDTVSQIWERLGGERAAVQQLSWVRPVAPWRHPLLLAHEVRRGEPRPSAVPPRPVEPAALLAALDAVRARLRLSTEYDLGYLTWLTAELPTAGLGSLRAAIVDGPDGAPVGAYAYYARAGGLSEVLAVVAATDDTTRTVLRALLDDARRVGAAALRGRLEPRLTGPVTRAGALLLHRPGALVHARDPALLHLATSRAALLTRLDGEWPLRPQAA